MKKVPGPRKPPCEHAKTRLTGPRIIEFPKGPMPVYSKWCDVKGGCKRFLYYCDQNGKRLS